MKNTTEDTKLIFWQNFISPHQIDFLNALRLNVSSITLLVDKEYDTGRISMGWERVHTQQINIIVNPNHEIIENCIKDPQNIHIFSGFRASACARNGIFQCKKNNIPFFIMAEAPNLFGNLIGSISRFFTYYLFYLKNRSLIYGIFAIGESGVKFYNKMPVENTKIAPFGYFINKLQDDLDVTKNVNEYHISFVGNLSKSKGVLEFLTIIKNIEHCKNFKVSIIGEGVLKENVIQFISKNQEINIQYSGFIENFLVKQHMRTVDLLCLINTGKEGWAVVINEALIHGSQVLCTTYTGSSCLLANDSEHKLGMVFSHQNIRGMSEYIEAKINEKTDRISERTYVTEWSKKILPDRAALYFLEFITYAMHSKSGKRPVTPWEI